jgi:hypothetical protein
MIPIGSLPAGGPKKTGGLDDDQKRINAMLGVDDATFLKYNPAIQ